MDSGRSGRPLARMYRARGDSARERAYADSARIAALAALRSGPPEAETLMSLAFGDSMLGRRGEALQAAARAVALNPISRDALYGPDRMIQLTQVEVMAGDNAAALAHLDTLLAIPSNVSPNVLRLDPSYAALRGDPHFQRLIATR